MLPANESENSTAAVKTKKPFGVWLISLFYAFSTIYTLLSMALLLTGVIPMTEGMRIYFANLTALDWLLTAVLSLLTITAAVSLFLLRKIALPLFCINFVSNFSMQLWHTLTKGLPAAMPTGGLVGAFIGSLLVGAAAIYVWRLKRKGILK